jgi:hypothetical protein
MTQRWIDAEGAAWPVTGHWCRLCGCPLDPVIVAAGFTDHGESDLPAPTTDPATAGTNERNT